MRTRLRSCVSLACSPSCPSSPSFDHERAFSPLAIPRRPTTTVTFLRGPSALLHHHSSLHRLCVLHVNTRQLRSAPILRSCTSCPSLPVLILISCRVSDLRGPRVHQVVEAPLPLQAWRAGRSMPPAQRTSCLGLLLHDYMYMSLRRLLSCDSRHVCYDCMLTLHSILIHQGR